ncbi:hypothetical protein BH10BAC3_BH10BAC3_11880 [soil metagenome]
MDIFLDEFGEWREDLIAANTFEIDNHRAAQIGQAIEAVQV